MMPILFIHEQDDAASHKEDSDEQPPNQSDSEGEEPVDPVSKQKYCGLNLKHVRELKVVVNNYGATAPYTLALSDNLSERWLTCND